MFVYLGKDTVIRASSIIAIINWEAVEGSENNHLFLKKAQTKELVRDIAGGKPHSMVITPNAVYLSSVSSTTLKKRAENPHYQAWDT
ncbi:MAG TPA: DUF370 domain-containing protein [Firmicutes bacterium]|nr:DUF370 domain-containing protein [Bacillota bacterium]